MCAALKFPGIPCFGGNKQFGRVGSRNIVKIASSSFFLFFTSSDNNSGYFYSAVSHPKS